MKAFVLRQLQVLLTAALLLAALGAHAAPASPPLLLAHYMPWFEADPASGRWGWHWTMHHFDPQLVTNGRRQIASHYYPLAGPYDSGDEDLLECQAQLMKLSGIDGVVFDWYGSSGQLDYGINSAHSMKFVPVLKKAGLRFCVMYEESTLPTLVKRGKLTDDQTPAQCRADMNWLETNWFPEPSYVRLGGKPVVMSFGWGYFNKGEWQDILSSLSPSPILFTEGRMRPGASGEYAWTERKDGLDRFYERAKGYPSFIASAYPGFRDIYADAGGKSYPVMDDENGATFVRTLAKGLASGAPIIQIATWNDWGEGTNIEPSVEFGYRYLETLQATRRKMNPRSMPYSAGDLRLPIKLYLLRKQYSGDERKLAALSAISQKLLRGNAVSARKALKAFPDPPTGSGAIFNAN